MMYYETDYLAHHGVKGQKWGRRKERVKKGIRRGVTTVRNSSVVRNQKRNVQTLAERRARTKNGNLRSKRSIIQGTIASTIAIDAGGAAAVYGLNKIGAYGLSKAVGLATTGATVANVAIGITSAVQRGRGKYGRQHGVYKHN